MDRTSCSTPSNDEPIERHQFYAKVSCHLIEAYRDINGLGQKVTAMYVSLDEVGDKVKEYATKGNTIIACISVVWLLLGGAFTMYVNSVIDAAQHTVAAVNELDKRTTILENANVNNAPAIDSIEKIKRNITTLQKEIEERPR